MIRRRHDSSIQRKINAPHLFQRGGFTLLECLVAISILSFVILALSIVSTSGHAHLTYGQRALFATRLAEQFLEEIESRPYQGHGSTRATFHLDDYDGLHEVAGNVRNFAGDLCDEEAQQFSREVEVTDESHSIAGFNGASIQGKTVTVTVRDSSDQSWQLSRFIPEPTTP
jgi:prepilin-type N-terminal cleavage/methylation domain-containing protein